MSFFKFRNKKISKEIIESNPDYDLSMFYERANEDLLIQQGNIDKVFTFFITVVSFATPYTLTANAFGTSVTSMLLSMIGLVSLVMAFIAMGYRGRCIVSELSMYTLTYLMNIKKSKINDSVVRAACYQTMAYEVSEYVYVNRKNKKRFRIHELLGNSLFNEENSYIIIMIAAALFFLMNGDLSSLKEAGIVINAQNVLYYFINYLITGAIILLFVALGYFVGVIYNIYAVVVTDSTKDFNRTFMKMKYLRFCRKFFSNPVFDMYDDGLDENEEGFTTSPED